MHNTLIQRIFVRTWLPRFSRICFFNIVYIVSHIFFRLLKVNESAVFQSPTIKKLRVLYNNYELDSSVNEYVTAIERTEETEFIDAVLATPVMRYTMQLLQQKGVVTADPRTHRDLLRTIWFNTYSRGKGKIGSSGFEHVFLTEIKMGTLSGLHNWLYFLEEEKQGNVDYKGYSKTIKLGNVSTYLIFYS